MMKKRIALWMAICMIALLAAACAQPAPAEEPQQTAQAAPAETPAAEETPAVEETEAPPGAKGYRPVGRAERAHLHGHGEAAVRWGTGTDPKQL